MRVNWVAENMTSLTKSLGKHATVFFIGILNSIDEIQAIWIDFVSVVLFWKVIFGSVIENSESGLLRTVLYFGF